VSVLPVRVNPNPNPEPLNKQTEEGKGSASEAQVKRSERDRAGDKAMESMLMCYVCYVCYVQGSIQGSIPLRYLRRSATEH